MLKDNPIISIIVPVFNAEKYLHRCLDSIMNQTYKNIELIVINDGSTDTSKSILEEYKNKFAFIFTLVHQANEGPSSAKNAGLDTAKGKYIIFIDSDDFIKPRYVEQLYNNITQSNADISMCNFLVYDETKNISYHNDGYDFQKISKIEGNENIIKAYLSDYFYGSIWASIYNSNIFKNIRFKRNYISEDWFLWLEIINRINCMSFYNGYEYFYSNNVASLTRKPSFKFKALEQQIEFINNKTKFINNLQQSYTFINNSLYISGLFREFRFIHASFVNYTYLIDRCKLDSFELDKLKLDYLALRNIIKPYKVLFNKYIKTKDKLKYFVTASEVTKPFINIIIPLFSGFVRQYIKSVKR